MKTKAIFPNLVLLISILAGLLSLQPAFDVLALSTDYQDEPGLKTIAYIGSDGNVWLINSIGEEKRKVTADGGYTDLKWSPDGQHLALVKSTPSSNRFSLFLHDLSQNPSRKIADDVQIFAWNPAGDRIAYYSDQIYIYDAILGETETTISAQYPYNWLIWDLAGQKIMYFSYDAGGIKSVDINTKSEAMVYSKASDEVGPPSFEELKYYPLTGFFFGWDYQSEGSGIPLVIDPNGNLIDLGEKTVKAVYPDATDGFFVTGYPSADWSPNGKEIVYGNNWDFGNGDLFLVNIDSYELFVLPAKGINPRWSPDGRRIAFITEKGGLNLLDMDSRNVQQLIPDVSNRYLDEVCGFGGCSGYSSNSRNEPQWSPDGRLLILPFKIGFFIASATGGEPTWVQDGFSAEWMPSSGITDLKVEPDLYQAENVEQDKYPIKLSWRNPGNLWNAGDIVSDFEVRMSDTPLDESNWDHARLLHAPSNPRAGALVEMTYNLSQADLGRSWFFGLKTKSMDGAWSPMSNIVGYIDSGFRPNRNGYAFTNDWGIDPEEREASFTDEDFYRMFFHNNEGVNICMPSSDTGTSCRLWPEFKKWIEEANKGTNIGQCLGMSVSSSLIYEDHSRISELGIDANNLFDSQVNLESEGVRRYISYFQVERGTKPLANIAAAKMKNTPAQAVDEIRQAFITAKAIILIVGKPEGAHAVDPIAISTYSNGFTILHTYDNVKPGKVSQIEVYPNGSWKYNIETRSLPEWFFFTLPSEEFTKQQSAIQTFTNISILPFLPIGSVLIEDQTGKQIGTNQAGFVNEIPLATFAPAIYDSDFPEVEPIYFLSKDNEYTIYLRDASETSQPASISQFGEHYSITVDNIIPSNGAGEIFQIASNGSHLYYKAATGQEPSFSITSRDDETAYIYQISGFQIDARQDLSVDVNPAEQTIVISSNTLPAFDLSITRIDSSGEQKFSHKQISFDGAKSLKLDLRSWNGSGAIKTSVDHAGDGQFDETARIKNEEQTGWPGWSTDYLGYVVLSSGCCLFLVGLAGILFVRMRTRKAAL